MKKNKTQFIDIIHKSQSRPIPPSQMIYYYMVLQHNSKTYFNSPGKLFSAHFLPIICNLGRNACLGNRNERNMFAEYGYIQQDTLCKICWRQGFFHTPFSPCSTFTPSILDWNVKMLTTNCHLQVGSRTQIFH